MNTMTTSSSLQESGLLTSDPHHLPGYCGHCPQFKFRYGKTFGQMTASLLTDEEVPTSGRNVLTDVLPTESQRENLGVTRSYLVNTRTQSKGDQKFVEKMVPGYSGFVPRSQNYFGTSYANVCKNSAADLELDYRKYDYNSQQMKFLQDVQTGKVKIDADQITPHLALSPRPLVPIAENAEPYKVGEKIQETVSPYNVNNLDPNKNFKSGYTGFLPRARDLLGEGYPSISNTALNRFSNENNRMYHMRTQPINVQSCITPPPRSKAVFATGCGMIPKYTGHVPGERFQHGKTYTKSTQAAIQDLPDVSI